LSWKLLDLVSEMSLEGRLEFFFQDFLTLCAQNMLFFSPIFFHCFSNSGATVFQFMMEAMESDEKYKGLKKRVLGMTLFSPQIKNDQFY